MQVGDLVKMRASIQPPHLYGIGLIMKVSGVSNRAQRCYVRWPTMPGHELKSCPQYALELVSESR